MKSVHGKTMISGLQEESETTVRTDERWSGLSESNRHLNLGKVPYYHYTKAARRPSFYSTTARQRQAFRTHADPYQNTVQARRVRKPR